MTKKIHFHVARLLFLHLANLRFLITVTSYHPMLIWKWWQIYCILISLKNQCCFSSFNQSTVFFCQTFMPKPLLTSINWDSSKQAFELPLGQSLLHSVCQCLEVRYVLCLYLTGHGTLESQVSYSVDLWEPKDGEESSKGLTLTEDLWALLCQGILQTVWSFLLLQKMKSVLSKHLSSSTIRWPSLRFWGVRFWGFDQSLCFSHLG